MYSIKSDARMIDCLQYQRDESCMLALWGLTPSLQDDLFAFCKLAIQKGMIIQNRLENPEPSQITYVTECVGTNCISGIRFSQDVLRICFPNLKKEQVSLLSEAITQVLVKMRNIGKSDSVLKNAFIKFLCWFYYKFPSVLSQLGSGSFFVLYEGELTSYELYMLTILAHCGGQIVMLDYKQQAKQYQNFTSFRILKDGMFETHTVIKQLKDRLKEEQLIDRLLPKSDMQLCVNAWMTQVSWNEILQKNRGLENEICSLFLRVDGVASRTNYLNQIYGLFENLQQNQREILILEDSIRALGGDEVPAMQCDTKVDCIQSICHALDWLPYHLKKYVQVLLCNRFLNETGNKVSAWNHIVVDIGYLLRYQNLIQKQGCVFVLQTHTLSQLTWSVLSLLVQTGVDVLVLNPNKVAESFHSDILLEQTLDDRMLVEQFPRERSEVVLSTTAYHAEHDLQGMLYQDTGLYRNRQYQDAKPVILQTMFEEIEQLWREPVSVRQGFSIEDGHVILPVLYAKVLGVKDGNSKTYQKLLERLVTGNEHVYFVENHVSFFVGSGFVSPATRFGNVIGQVMNSVSDVNTNSPVCDVNIAEVLTNRRIDLEKLKKHSKFKYGYLQEDTLRFMSEQLNQLLWSGIVEGIGKHGNENQILEMFFQLPEEVVQLIQKFDFTKVNPKIVYLNTGNSVLTFKETLFFQYLSLLGFDVVFFLPTGYNIVDGYFVKKLYVEHQLGEYKYDMQIHVRKKKFLF